MAMVLVMSGSPSCDLRGPTAPQPRRRKRRVRWRRHQALPPAGGGAGSQDAGGDIGRPSSATGVPFCKEPPGRPQNGPCVRRHPPIVDRTDQRYRWRRGLLAGNSLAVVREGCFAGIDRKRVVWNAMLEHACFARERTRTADWPHAAAWLRGRLVLQTQPRLANAPNPPEFGNQCLRRDAVPRGGTRSGQQVKWNA
jgi:hypothetical protein